MDPLRTTLILANSLVFLAIGFTLIVRLKEAKGSLRKAKISVVMAAFSTAGSFLTEAISQLTYQPLNYQSELLVKQLYVVIDLFAMLVLAFVASFAVFATYSGRRRKLIVLLTFLVALIPTTYLTLTYSQAIVAPPPPDIPESYVLTAPPLTYILYALCGIPLGVMPLMVFSRSFIMARKRGDKVLSQRGAMMLSAIMLNEAVYLIYVFWSGIVELTALVVWIPVALFLLFAVLKITSPVGPKT